MDDYQNLDFFKLQSSDLAGRTPFCPEDREIAEYYDNVLPTREHLKLERHLSDCQFCLSRIGILERLSDDDDQVHVPEDLLAFVKQIPDLHPGRSGGIVRGWAVAAVLVMALAMTYDAYRQFSPGTETAEPAHSSANPVERQLRSASLTPTGIPVFTPLPGSQVKPGQLIQWGDVHNRSGYSIFILSATGDLLFTGHVKGTEWRLQENLELTPGSEYFFRVEAELPGGATASSKHLAFRVADLR